MPCSNFHASLEFVVFPAGFRHNAAEALRLFAVTTLVSLGVALHIFGNHWFCCSCAPKRLGVLSCDSVKVPHAEWCRLQGCLGHKHSLRTTGQLRTSSVNYWKRTSMELWRVTKLRQAFHFDFNWADQKSKKGTREEPAPMVGIGLHRQQVLATA